MNKKIWLVLMLVLALMLAGCSKTEKAEEKAAVDPAAPHPVVTIEMKDRGTIKVELYPEQAPNTVANFVTLVQEGFYDGLTFHRIIPGFMIQGGDPMGMGIGGPGYSIKGEFSQNGVQNDLKHTRGVISMARSARPDSAGSQFFIMHKDAPHLDGQYAAFGKLTAGEDTLDEIAEVDTDYSDRPLDEQKIKTVTIVEA
ncbi:MAG: peptidylprolyl isomerase [Clostridia bacterium]|nr:peptidylprolyl isomerase [Clostridia bacterium]